MLRPGAVVCVEALTGVTKDRVGELVPSAQRYLAQPFATHTHTPQGAHHPPVPSHHSSPSAGRVVAVGPVTAAALTRTSVRQLLRLAALRAKGARNLSFSARLSVADDSGDADVGAGGAGGGAGVGAGTASDGTAAGVTTFELSECETIGLLGKGRYGRQCAKVQQRSYPTWGSHIPSACVHSFGMVNMVRWKGKVVALKAISKQHIATVGQVKHVIRERDIMAALRHPFIATLYGVSQDDNNLYMLLELLQGGELVHSCFCHGHHHLSCLFLSPLACTRHTVESDLQRVLSVDTRQWRHAERSRQVLHCMHRHGLGASPR